MSPPLRPTALAPALRTEADAAPPASDARAARDGCGCAALGWGVSMCAHFGVMILRLLDARLLPNVVTDPDDGVRFVVENDDEADAKIDELYAGNDHDAALRAFRDAEVRLLAGEEEGR